jgi:hypothetical protein
MELVKVKRANRIYFSLNNQRFCNDIDYSMGEAKNGEFFFINHTFAFTNMGDGIKKAHFRLSTVNQITGEILKLNDTIFPTMTEVNTFLESR